jgi:heat shock protein HtpX
MAAATAPPAVLVYDRVAKNRRATRRLLTVFALLILPFIAGLVPLLAPAIHLGALQSAFGRSVLARLQSIGGAVTVAVTTMALGVLLALAGGVAVAWLEFWQATRLVLRFTRARPVGREEEPELWRTVENLSLGAGLPTPKVYVIESADANAFAVGPDPDRSAVVVTRGLLRLLDRRGLEGVIAHELSHIGNQDTRLNTLLAGILTVLRLPLDLLRMVRLFRRPVVVKACLVLSGFMAVIAVVSMLAIVSQIAAAVWLFPGEVREFLAAAGQANVALIVFVGALIFYGPFFMGSPFYVLFGAQLCGRRVGAAVSRQREFLADADAVLLTRDPEGLALALVQVGAAGGTSMNLPRAAAHLFFVDPPAAETGWWDRAVPSHPPIEARVAALAQMGSGIPPEAIARARQAGERFRMHETTSREGSCSSGR